MSNMKEQRWYELANDVLYIYNRMNKNNSTSVSICKPEDLSFYRKNFKLRKVLNDQESYPNTK